MIHADFEYSLVLFKQIQAQAYTFNYLSIYLLSRFISWAWGCVCECVQSKTIKNLLHLLTENRELDNGQSCCIIIWNHICSCWLHTDVTGHTLSITKMNWTSTCRSSVNTADLFMKDKSALVINKINFVFRSTSITFGLIRYPDIWPLNYILIEHCLNWIEWMQMNYFT